MPNNFTWVWDPRSCPLVDPHVGSFFMILIWPGGAASGGHVLPLHWLLKNQVSGIRKPMRRWHVSKESAKATDRFASCRDPSSGRWGDILRRRVLFLPAGRDILKGSFSVKGEAFWREQQRAFGGGRFLELRRSKLRRIEHFLERENREVWRCYFPGRQRDILENIFWLEEDIGDRVRREHSQVPSSWFPY